MRQHIHAGFLYLYPPTPTVHHFSYRFVSTRLQPKRQTLQHAFRSKIAFLKLSRGFVVLCSSCTGSPGIRAGASFIVGLPVHGRVYVSPVARAYPHPAVTVSDCLQSNQDHSCPQTSAATPVWRPESAAGQRLQPRAARQAREGAGVLCSDFTSQAHI